MGRFPSSRTFLILLLLLFMEMETGRTLTERENISSSAGMFWSTAKEEGDLVLKAAGPADDSTADGDGEDIDGGFSSLDGMLQWAIGLVIPFHIYFSHFWILKEQKNLIFLYYEYSGHSDSTKLKEAAQDAQRLSPSELKQRQSEIKVFLFYFPVFIFYFG